MRIDKVHIFHLPIDATELNMSFIASFIRLEGLIDMVQLLHLLKDMTKIHCPFQPLKLQWPSWKIKNAMTLARNEKCND